MTVRYYVLPIEQIGNARGPKYFSWKMNPNGIKCPWSMKDYGSINQAVICADIAAADHTSLAANADVLSVPVNVDQTLNTNAVTTAVTFLENYNIPAGWITTGLTNRTVLRTVTAFFLFFQRVTAILGRNIDLPANWLNYQIQNISAEIRNAMAQAADELDFDYSAVTGTTTMRQILKGMADAWGSTSILFGLATL